MNDNAPLTEVRTRFAPSPTGYLHIGGLRTALYAYLFAKKNNGKVLLRIEDTDQSRFVEGATENLIKSLKWGGVEFDEGPHIGGDYGPYTQSERTDIYREYAEKLLESGHAYRCFCTKERLDEMRAEQQKRKVQPMYDRTCLYLSEEEIEEKLKAGIPYVIRLKVPHDENIEFDDLIRGHMEFKGYTIDDQVLVKSDGFPTYHLANVVDDHLMKISHVIRGEEWLPSTPKHIVLYKAFGWHIPQFAHIPLLLNEDKTKLSKRQGHVAVEEYMNEGYLPEAVTNFIALLGWNPGTEQEIFSMKELEKAFDIGRVQKAGAVFSLEKMQWVNKQYLKKMPVKELIENITPHLEDAKLPIPEDIDYFVRAVDIAKDRITTYKDAPEHLALFLQDPETYNLDLFIHEKMKVDHESAKKALEAVIDTLKKVDTFTTPEAMKEIIVQVIQEMGVKNGQVMWPLRVALTNAEFSPGVFELLVCFGKDRSIKRLEKALEAIA